MPERRPPVRELPAIELRSDLRGQLHEFSQSFHCEPALLLERFELQLALEQDFHDFVVLYDRVRHCPPRPQGATESNIRARIGFALMESPPHTENPCRMPRFFIVVKSSNEGLYRALEEALVERIGFSVVRDRRGNQQDPWPSDRRKARVWETGELAFAACEDEY
jgi:hypothetical protein